MLVFLIQRISAIALVVFLTIHMIVVHYPPFHIDFSQIIQRLDQPLWKAIDIVFLFAVLVHAVAGAYVVLTDVQSVNKYKLALAWAAIIIGIVGFIYGTMTVLAFHPSEIAATLSP